MRLDLDGQGGWLITPAQLAHRLGMSELAYDGKLLSAISIAALIEATAVMRAVRV